MKTVASIMFAFLFVSCCLAQGAPAPDSVEAAEMKMMMAVMNHDPAAFKAICDPQYRTVNEEGSAADLNETLAEMRTDPLKMDAPPEMSERLVRISGDTAFISGRWKFAKPDKSIGDIRYTETWVKRDGQWKFIQWQATRVTPEGLEREKKFKAAAAAGK